MLQADCTNAEGREGGALHTDFPCYVGVQATEYDVTVFELARLALLDNQVAHFPHRSGLLPLDGITVLLARGLWRRADGDKLEEGVVLQEQDESLADRASCTQYAWCQGKLANIVPWEPR